MSERNPISDRILTTFSLTGLLLGLLVNAIVTIRFEEYNPEVASLIKVSFLFDTGFLIMSVLEGIIAYTSITDKNPDIDAEMLLKSTYDWLLTGLGFISVTIALIITNSLNWAVGFMLVLGFLAFYESYRLKKNKYCQPVQQVTETEFNEHPSDNINQNLSVKKL